jgi:hypothetical protein
VFHSDGPSIPRKAKLFWLVVAGLEGSEAAIRLMDTNWLKQMSYGIAALQRLLWLRPPLSAALHKRTSIDSNRRVV